MRKSFTSYLTLVFSILIQFNPPKACACGSGASTVTNLPSLGGSTVQVSGINSAGQIAGTSYTTGDRAARAFRYSSGTTADLGTLGGNNSQGFAINSQGWVAGEADLAHFAGTHAVLVKGGAPIDLGTLGGSYSSAAALNDAGQVVGSSLTAGDSEMDAFLFDGTSMTNLGSLGGGGSSAKAINQNGLITGDLLDENFENHAFVFANGAMTDLGTLGGDYSSPFALNDSGLIVGESSTTNSQTHAFVYSGGPMQDIGTLGGTYSTAAAVNNAGQVVGTSTTLNDASTDGFIWSAGVMTDLGTLGGTDTEPASINSLGQVVGYSITGGGQSHAFLWQNGTIADLNTLLPTNSGWELFDALLINDSGRIVGDGAYNGVSQTYVLDFVAANHSPVAVAGADQTVECPTPVTLDGSASSDPDGDALTFEWRLSGNVIGTNSTLSGTFSLGTNVVTLKVNDPCGSSSEATVKVIVVDTTAPTISCPGNVTVSVNTNCLAAAPDLTSLATASDSCGSVSVTQNPVAGTLLGLGAHTVTLTATDASGNTASCSTTLTVADKTPPVIISGPAIAPISAGAGCQAAVPAVTSQIVATDNCTPSGSLAISQNPIAGTSVGLGQHNILITVTDGAGNSASGSLSFSVVDTTAPTILSVPGPFTASSDANCQAPVPNVLSGVQASDGCTPANQLVLTQSPIAGTSLGLGQHTIVVSVTDASGNTSTANVSFTVVDTTAPSITSAPSSLTVSANAQCLASVPNVIPSIVAADNCTPANQLVITQSPAAGTTLGHGQYTITVTVTDAAGNSTSQNIPFTVADTTAPTIQSLSVNPNVLSTSNGKPVPVTVSATVSDNCDSAPFTRITSITANESTAAGDIQITGNLTANLAATRNPAGNGRIYTITVTSTDASGNSSTSTVNVSVPKGKKG